MDIKSKEIEYQVKLEGGEDIEIKVNGISVFTEAVPVEYTGNVYFKYKENKD